MADWGFHAPGVSIHEFCLPQQYAGNLEAQIQLIESVLTAVGHTPGVESTAVGYTAPFRLGSWKEVLLAVDGRFRSVGALYKVSPGYFASLGTRFLAGGDFPRVSDPSQPWGVIVSKRVADRIWPNQTPLGQRLRIMRAATDARGVPLAHILARERAGDESVYAESGNILPVEPGERTVIGVVENVRMAGLNAVPRWGVYIDYRQQYSDDWFGELDHRLITKSFSDPGILDRAIRSIIRRTVPGATVGQMSRLEDLVKESIGAVGAGQLALVSLAALGIAAFALAWFGVYGIVESLLDTRARRHAVQMALGATPERVQLEIGAILARGVVWAIILGAVGALCGVRILSAYFPVPIAQLWIWTTLSVAVVLLGLGFAAIRALRRLFRLNPIEILRD